MLCSGDKDASRDSGRVSESGDFVSDGRCGVRKRQSGSTRWDNADSGNRGVVRFDRGCVTLARYHLVHNVCSNVGVMTNSADTKGVKGRELGGTSGQGRELWSSIGHIGDDEVLDVR
jgi:hypothetical protein